MDLSPAMDVDQDANSNPSETEQISGPTLQPLDGGNAQNKVLSPETQVQTSTASQERSDKMEVDSSDQARTEKRKRAATEELERGRVRIVESEKNKSLVKRLEAEISELKRANANLENEIDDVNYQLKTEISDLKRANQSFRDELINLRAVDVSVVDDINPSSLTPRESEKLIPLITKLQLHIKYLEDPSRYIAADIEPSNEVEKNLLDRINQLQILYDTALKQQRAFLDLMKSAQRDKDAFHQQATGLQEANTRVQRELRQLQAGTQQTPDQRVQDLQSRIKQLLAENNSLQSNVEALRKAQEKSADAQEHIEKELPPEFRSISAQTDGEDVVLELENLRANMSRIEKDLEEVKQERESFRNARDRVAVILKSKKEEYKKEKEQLDVKLQEAAGRERVLKDEKASAEAQLDDTNRKIQEDSRKQDEKLAQLHQELSTIREERDVLKNELVELGTVNDNLKQSNNELSGKTASAQKELDDLKKVSTSTFEDLKNEYGRMLEEQRHQASEDFTRKMQDLEKNHNETLDSALREKNKAEKKLTQQQSANQREIEELRASNQRDIEELHATNQTEIERLQTDKNKSDSRVNSLERDMNSLKAEYQQALKLAEQAKNNLQTEATQVQNEAKQLKVCLLSLNYQIECSRFVPPKQTIEEKDSLIQQLQTATRESEAAHTALDGLYQEAIRRLSEANAAKDIALGKLADEQKQAVDTQLLYESLQSQHRACQVNIEALKKNSNSKITEATGIVKKYLADLKRAKEQMEEAGNSVQEKTEEIARLQEEVAKLKMNSQMARDSTPAAPSLLPASRQTLNGARVTAEFQCAAEAESSNQNASRPRYRLGGVIPTAQFPWGNNQPSRFTTAGRRLRAAGQENPDDSDSDDNAGNNSSGHGNNAGNNGPDGQNYLESDSSDEGDDEMEERDDHVIRRKWERMGRKKKYTQQQQNINCSRLARDLVLACLGSKHLFEGFARDQVDNERLTNFHVEPTAYGPKLRNSRLDKRGMSTQQMLDESHWNQTLMHNLANEAAVIFANCPDKRFGEGPEDGWYKMIRVRIQPILKTHLEALPKFPGEPLRERIQRVAARYEKIKEYNKRNNILHTKYHVRASVGAIMTQVLHERGDNEGEEMWQYVLKSLSWLEHDGMSDEEEGSELVTIDGRESRIQVRKVMKLSWRHPSFRRLFEMIDQTREVEAAIFAHQGRPPMKRIRVDQGPTRQRPPPQHLPASFFNPEYLQELQKFPYQIENLRLSRKDFPLREVSDLPDFDGP
ncbi:hypothetical protein VKT23_019326 [Stygiomarasmius scandens]|uniref:Uncharacterized protein n=1 Tax=Marasmiellus scandens TaxID=2682957 RepID=A0ABR1ILW3_9AGAR